MDLLSDKKVMASLQSALLFLVVANPVTYRFVNSIFGFVVKVANSNSGAPTTFGLILHSLVFGLIAYLLMNISKPIPDAIMDRVRSMTGDMVPADKAIAVDVQRADKEIAEAVMRKEELRVKNDVKKLAKAAKSEVKNAEDAKNKAVSVTKSINNTTKKLNNSFKL